MNKYLSIITLNENGLIAPIKKHRIAEWTRNHSPHIGCLQETHLRKKDLYIPKVKGWKKNIPSKWTGKKSQGSNNHIRQNGLQKKAPYKETQKDSSKYSREESIKKT